MNLNSWRNVPVALIVVSSLGFIGCGETRTDLGTVTGTIKLNGELLADAQIEFVPKTSTGSTAYGKTDNNGFYTMQATRDSAGAALGQNTVRITTADVIERDGEEVVVSEKLPPKYNEQSELTADVQPGDNTFDFALEASEADIKQPNLTDE